MIGAGELVVIAIVLVLVAGQLAAIVALIVWGRWVAQRVPGTLWSAAAWMPVLGLVLQLVGGCGSGAMMVRAFQSVGSVDPASRATVLAQSISTATNVAALTFLTAVALYVTSVVVFAIGTAQARAPRGAREA